MNTAIIAPSLLAEATDIIRSRGCMNPDNGCSIHDREHCLDFAPQLMLAGVAFWHHNRLIAMPIVGLGATHIGYSDRHPYEIISVHKSTHMCVLRPMHAEKDPTWKPEWHVGGFAGHCSNQSDQRWTLSSLPDCVPSLLKTIRLHKGGDWRTVDGERYSVGQARRFHDYNF